MDGVGEEREYNVFIMVVHETEIYNLNQETTEKDMLHFFLYCHPPTVLLTYSEAADIHSVLQNAHKRAIDKTFISVHILKAENKTDPHYP